MVDIKKKHEDFKKELKELLIKYDAVIEVDFDSFCDLTNVTGGLIIHYYAPNRLPDSLSLVEKFEVEPEDL